MKLVEDLEKFLRKNELRLEVQCASGVWQARVFTLSGLLLVQVHQMSMLEAIQGAIRLCEHS